MDVWEYMVHRHANPDAGNLGSPEEVPMLIYLEVFIPANRLQDVAMATKQLHTKAHSAMSPMRRYSPRGM